MPPHARMRAPSLYRFSPLRVDKRDGAGKNTYYVPRTLPYAVDEQIVAVDVVSKATLINNCPLVSCYTTPACGP